MSGAEVAGVEGGGKRRSGVTDGAGSTEAAGDRDGGRKRGRPQGTTRRRAREAAIEARRALVAQGLLAGKRVREIAAELADLPPEARPGDCSKSTIGRDALRLRAEWAQARAAALEARLAAPAETPGQARVG